jgi:hypothetical protein
MKNITSFILIIWILYYFTQKYLAPGSLYYHLTRSLFSRFSVSAVFEVVCTCVLLSLAILRSLGITDNRDFNPRLPKYECRSSHHCLSNTNCAIRMKCNVYLLDSISYDTTLILNYQLTTFFHICNTDKIWPESWLTVLIHKIHVTAFIVLQDKLILTLYCSRYENV